MNTNLDSIRARCEAAIPDGLETLDSRIKNLASGLHGMQENGTMQVSKTFLHTICAYMVELLACRRDEIPLMLSEIDRLTAENAMLKSQVDIVDNANEACLIRIAELEAKLAASQRRERAHEAAIRRHYNDMTSQCFICYSCVNHDARQKAKWDGKKLEDYACSGCGDGKPNWKFDVERFMGQEGRK